MTNSRGATDDNTDRNCGSDYPISATPQTSNMNLHDLLGRALHYEAKNDSTPAGTGTLQLDRDATTMGRVPPRDPQVLRQHLRQVLEEVSRTLEEWNNTWEEEDE